MHLQKKKTNCEDIKDKIPEITTVDRNPKINEVINEITSITSLATIILL